jgi:type I restriction enzyme S subunit
MKKYDNYKDSGIEWIGEIPEHWDRIRIKSLVAIKVTDGPHETPQWIENGVPFISAEAIKGNKIDLDFKRGCISTEQHLEYCKKSKVLKNDILFCKSGSTTGKSALVDTDVDFGIWSPLAIIRADKNKIDYKYLFQSIQSSLFQNQVETAWTFGTQPNIGMGALENLWIAIPTLEEQKSIANYLDHKTTQIDTLISKKQQFITLLQEERIAVINQAVTKGLDPKVKMKDSGIEWLGEIPEHWTSYRIDWVTNIVRGNTGFKKDELLKNGEYVALQYGKTYKVDIVDDSFNFFVNSEFFKESQVVSKGDTILISTSETVEDLGHTCFYNNGNIGLLGGEQILLKPNRKVLYEKYLYQYARQFCLELKKYAKGLKVFRFNTTDLKQIFIAIPSIEEQIQIADFLDCETIRIDSLIYKMKKEIELLKEYKTALISEVVTGKVDVRDVVLN